MSISDCPLPAKLYDLPGIGAVNRIHDNIVRERMRDADAYIYVANATKTLGQDELELIRFVYDNHKTGRLNNRSGSKPVIWVVTAIDRAWDAQGSKRAYEATVSANNDYLAAHFTENGQADTRFIGAGFLPVSPALRPRDADCSLPATRPRVSAGSGKAACESCATCCSA